MKRGQTVRKIGIVLWKPEAAEDEEADCLVKLRCWFVAGAFLWSICIEPFVMWILELTPVSSWMPVRGAPRLRADFKTCPPEMELGDSLVPTKVQMGRLKCKCPI